MVWTKVVLVRSAFVGGWRGLTGCRSFMLTGSSLSISSRSSCAFRNGMLHICKRANISPAQNAPPGGKVSRCSETLPEASASAAGPCTGRFERAPEGLTELPGRPLSRSTSNQSPLAQVASQGSQRSLRLTDACGEILELMSQHTDV